MSERVFSDCSEYSEYSDYSDFSEYSDCSDLALHLLLCIFHPLCGKVFLQAAAPQLAGGTLAAAVAYDAVVARERAVAYDGIDAQLVGQGPCLGLVQPHQGRVDAELVVHGQVECHVQALDEGVATVGIAAEVCLPHAGDQIVDAADGIDDDKPGSLSAGSDTGKIIDKDRQEYSGGQWKWK